MNKLASIGQNRFKRIKKNHFLIILALLILQFSPAEGTKDRGAIVVTEEGLEIELYSKSYALLIGNSKYDFTATWQELDWPDDDVDKIEEVLKGIEFDVEKYENIKSDEFRKITSRFIRTKGRDKDAQVLFYFAGHGYTEPDVTGSQTGYIIMKDTPPANDDEFFSKAIAMESLQNFSKQVLSKHMLFIFDSCFSGTILKTRETIIPEAIREAMASQGREYITAGKADEPVPDRSIFKEIFLRTLRGDEQQAFPDNYLTAMELAVIMKNRVPVFWPRQHPQYGKASEIEFSEGEFVFILKKPDEPPPNGRKIVKIVINALPWARFRLTPLDKDVTLNIGERQTPCVLDVPEGSYKIELTHDDYEALTMRIAVSSTGNKTFTFQMPGYDPYKIIQ